MKVVAMINWVIVTKFVTCVYGVGSFLHYINCFRH